MFVQLQSGYLQESDSKEDSESVLERPCILVYEGDFESMDGPVSVTSDHIEKLAKNHNGVLSKIKRMGGWEEVPAKMTPPLQLDHSTSARDTVGRVPGELSIGSYTTEDGKTVKALYGRVRVLGKENVERVKDGRWTHLSIGADLEEGKLSELTITPFPAAAEASLLGRGNLKGDDKMFKKLKAFFEKNKNLSDKDFKARLKKLMDEEEKEEKKEEMSNAEDAPDALAKFMEDEEKMAKRLQEDDENLSEEDAKEKLKKMNEDEKKDLAKKLQDEEDDDEEMSNAEDAPDALADGEEDEDKEKMKKKKMSSNQKKIAKLAADFRKKSGSVSLAAKKAKITSRLSRLRADAKITPAEVKKRFSDDNLSKLAKSTQETIDAVFESYESREPVIPTGIFGTSKAESLAELSKKAEVAQLEAETRKNFKSLGKNKNKGDEGNTRLSEISVLNEMLEVSESYRSDYDSICRLMEDGKVKEAKVALRQLVNSGNIVDKSVSTETQLSGLADELEKLQNQFNELIQLVSAE